MEPSGNRHSLLEATEVLVENTQNFLQKKSVKSVGKILKGNQVKLKTKMPIIVQWIAMAGKKKIKLKENVKNVVKSLKEKGAELSMVVQNTALKNVLENLVDYPSRNALTETTALSGPRRELRHSPEITSSVKTVDSTRPSVVTSTTRASTFTTSFRTEPSIAMTRHIVSTIS